MASDDRKARLIRSTAAVAAPTLVSRVLGYIRDLLQAYYLGTGTGADAFIIAFTIPNLFRRLTGEGAMTPAFVPTFTELKGGPDGRRLWRFGNVFFWDLALIMAVMTGLGILFAPGLVKVIAYGFGDVAGKWGLTIFMTRIMFPYLFFITLAALASGILNSFGRFFIPASTPILFNIVIIAAVTGWARDAREPALVFAAAVVIGGILQLALQVPFLWKEGMRFTFGLSFRDPMVRRVGRLMVPGIFGASVYQINFALSRMIASGLEEGSASALYYASRIEELTLGLFSIALAAALLPAFSEQVAARDIGELKKTLGFSLKLTAVVSFPAAAGLMALNVPIMRTLFERGQFDQWVDRGVVVLPALLRPRSAFRLRGQGRRAGFLLPQGHPDARGHRHRRHVREHRGVPPAHGLSPGRRTGPGPVAVPGPQFRPAPRLARAQGRTDGNGRPGRSRRPSPPPPRR